MNSLSAQRPLLTKIGIFAWYALVFLQPFTPFGALRIISTAILLAALLGELWIRRPPINSALASRVAVAIALWATISSLIGPYPTDSLHSLRKDLLPQALMLIAAFTYVRAPADIWHLVRVALAGFATVTLLAVAEICLFWSQHGFSLWIERGHGSFWGGYASTGAFYLPLLAAWLFTDAKNRYLACAGWIIFATGITLVLLYGSRSPLLTAIIALIVLGALLKRWRSLAAATFIFCGALTLAHFTHSDGNFRYKSLLKSETYVTNQGLGLRLALWDGCWQVIQERPLSGYGYGWKKLAWAINDGPFAERWSSSQPDVAGYYLQNGKASYGRVNPHNYPLQVMFEIGIVGFILVLLFWTEILRKSIALIRHPDPGKRQQATCLLIALIAYALSNLGNGYWIGGLANLSVAFAGCILFLTKTENLRPPRTI